MRKSMFILITVSVIGLVIFSCEKIIDNQLIMTGQLIGNTDCKSGLLSGSEVDETPDSLSCVDYSFDVETNKLSLKHINAGFNCCPDSLYCTIRLVGDTILIQEFEKTAKCNCNCLYDLDIEINGVDVKKYQVKFIEPYASEQSKLEFEMDLTSATNGSFSVTRKLYPWGVISLNE